MPHLTSALHSLNINDLIRTLDENKELFYRRYGENGCTIFHAAVIRNSSVLLYFSFIETAAHPLFCLIKDSNGQNALDIALEQRKSDLVALYFFFLSKRGYQKQAVYAVNCIDPLLIDKERQKIKESYAGVENLIINLEVELSKIQSPRITSPCFWFSPIKLISPVKKFSEEDYPLCDSDYAALKKSQ